MGSSAGAHPSLRALWGHCPRYPFSMDVTAGTGLLALLPPHHAQSRPRGSLLLPNASLPSSLPCPAFHPSLSLRWEAERPGSSSNLLLSHVRSELHV